MVDGKSRIISDPPLIVPIDELMGSDWHEVEDQFRVMFRDYRRTLTSERRLLLERYELAHVARKVVGVGSVGTRAWIALLIGRDESDPIFIQVKEAQPSVLEPFLGRSEYDNCGQRVVAGQRLMQSASDLFLGWLRPAQGTLDEQRRDFYLRQLSDWKGGADIAVMRHRGMVVYGRLCAWTLARAHARSGDSIAIASYLGSRRPLRSGHRRVRRSLCGPERPGLQPARRGRQVGTPRGGDGPVNQPTRTVTTGRVGESAART